MSRFSASIASIIVIAILVCAARAGHDSPRAESRLFGSDGATNSAVTPTTTPGTSGVRRVALGSDAARDGETRNDKDDAHQRARDIFNCIKLWNSRKHAEALLTVPISNLNPIQLASHDAALNKSEHDLDRASSESSCDDVDEAYARKNLYPALLGAAEAGDWDAAACYTIAPFDPADDQLTEEGISSYTNAARKFIVGGMLRGDWRFVSLAELSVGDRSMRHPGQFKRSLFHRFIIPDEKMRYGYARLERLGATGDYANQLDAQLDAMASRLSEKDLQEMNRWADEEYRINFAGKPQNESPRTYAICSDVKVHGIVSTVRRRFKKCALNP